jgi:hypothetical protein
VKQLTYEIEEYVGGVVAMAAAPARTSRSVVANYVYLRIAQARHGDFDADEDQIDGLVDVATAIEALAKEFEQRYEQVFHEACGQMFLTPDSAQGMFMTAVQTLFADGSINWGRVIALFAFGGCVAAQCIEKEMPGLVEPVITWVSQYIDSHLTSWILEHGGWEGLVVFYRKGAETRNGTSWPSIGTLCRAFSAIGALTLGAILAQR